MMYIYLIRAGAAFKVGGTNNPEGRLKNMQTHSPEACSLMLAEPGGHATEGRLRRHFRALGLHIRGEWFRWKPSVLEQAKRILSNMQDDAAMPKPATTEPRDGLAARMQKARIDRNMTQGQLAERLRVRQSMVSMIENGEEVEDGVKYSDELASRIKSWIDSGAGPAKKSPRGPYAKQRVTIKR